MNLIVANVEVAQDQHGRFCLNDLQRAATVGRNPRTSEVHEYMRRPETLDLIDEIENTGNSRIKAAETKRGRNGGTYVCKELVYAYAMWISPKFHLAVIRAYDAMASQPANDPKVPMDRQLSVANREFKAALGIAKAVGLKGNQAALSADRAVTRSLGVSPLKMIGHEGLETDVRAVTATELGRECDLNARQMNELLESCGYQTRTRDAKNALVWKPSELGMPFAVLLDTGKKHGDGTPVTQLKWKPDILKHIGNLLQKKAG